jgi:putative ABC transport system permease protein
MIRNYFKTAFRGLYKNRGFTLINVMGLALGLTVCLLIVLYVTDELSFDRFNVKADRIYRINHDIKFGGSENTFAVSPAPAAAAIKADFPEVEQVTRFRLRGGFQVKKGTQNIRENRVVYSDPTVFDVFTLPMVAGNADKALAEPNCVVITESTAKKYFKRTNVLGRTLTFNDNLLYKVTGVIKDIPKQSHFNFDFFISMPTLDESRQTTWLNNNFNTYIVLKPGADYRKLGAKLQDFIIRHSGPEMQEMLHLSYKKFEQSGNYFKFHLVPLRDIHLHENAVLELGSNGDIQYIYIFSAIALFILLIACVNFMNLSTARSSNRAREVGVRKVLGSARKHLIWQFLTESLVLTFISAVIAVFAAWALLPLFNGMSGKELVLTPSIFARLIPVMLLFTVVVGCLAGSYPALYLSAFQPIQVLKGKLTTGFKASNFRSFLVIFQFSISIFLIIGTMVIYNQLAFIRNKDLGYSREHILVIKNTWALGTQAKAFKHAVKRLSGVESATFSGYLPTEEESNGSSFFKDPIMDQKRALLTQVWSVDEDYLPTLGIKLADGRNFSKDMLTDSGALIINEAAAKLLGFKHTLNSALYRPTDDNGSTRKYNVIGVIKNFNFRSLRENITPLLLTLEADNGALSIRMKSTDIPSLLRQIEAEWKQLTPNNQFKYSFMDQDFDALYRTEQRMGKIAVTFTSLAILIACLGLFGLAAYAAEQRTKEIGIRKVLGASVSAIVGMLSKDFISLVLIAIVVATPLASFAMNRWLEGFAYRQNIQWWVVALAGSLSIIIAFITISFQSIKAALINPVKSLRSE